MKIDTAHQTWICIFFGDLMNEYSIKIVGFLGSPRTLLFFALHARITASQLPRASFHLIIFLQRGGQLYFALILFIFLLIMFNTLLRKFANIHSLYSTLHQKTWYKQPVSHYFSTSLIWKVNNHLSILEISRNT